LQKSLSIAGIDTFQKQHIPHLGSIVTEALNGGRQQPI